MCWDGKIRDAIERSRASGLWKAVSVGLTVDALEDLLLAMLQGNWEMTKVDDSRVGVRGWSGATPEGEPDWAICVRCAPVEEMAP
jgi:hypothetical protein